MPYNSNGAGQAQLTVPNVRNISFPLPPLPLQQSFASKIEAIERQKALIQQSIAEVQMLFDSRMDDWFA
jgi:type I restriction enzyme S subunit